MKPRVLAGAQGFDENLRHFVDRDHAAVLDEDPADFLAIPVHDHARDFKIVDAVQIIGLGTLAVFAGVVFDKHPARAGSQPRRADRQDQPKAFALEEPLACGSSFGSCFECSPCLIRIHRHPRRRQSAHRTTRSGRAPATPSLEGILRRPHRTGRPAAFSGFHGSGAL